MKHSVPYDAMEVAARKHAHLDQTTAVLWEEEARVCSRLRTIEHKLQMLREGRSGVARKGTGKDKSQTGSQRETAGRRVAG